jgi:NAD(P)H-hydrate epimerase
MEKITNELVASLLIERKKDGSKVDFGHALLIAGEIGKMGAAVISSRACLRTGVGLLTLNTPIEERQIVQIAIPEAMIVSREDFNYNLNYFTAIGIGPGIGTKSTTFNLLKTIVEKTNSPLVLDADALNLIAKNEFINSIPKKSILTPHEREFDRLFGEHLNHETRIQTAILQSKKLDCVIVLKSATTHIIYHENIFINSIGNAGLAKGGSGDALTGIITSFLAQGYSPLNSAIIGVYIHSLAADLTLKNQSVESMLITDVIENIGLAFKMIRQEKRVY